MVNGLIGLSGQVVQSLVVVEQDKEEGIAIILPLNLEANDA